MFRNLLAGYHRATFGGVFFFLTKLDGRWKTAGQAGRSLCNELALLLGFWQFIDFVRCHVDQNGVADAVKLPAGDGDHVATETEKAAYLYSDGGFAVGLGHYTLNSAKVGPVRRLHGKTHQATGSGWCRSFLLSRRRWGRCQRHTGFRFRRCRRA
jgi:hypothetical protein